MAPHFFAHSTERADKSDWQGLSDHLEAVARGAAARARKFGAGDVAALAGLLHDLGKYSDAFQKRLEGGPAVEHATAGARLALDLARKRREERKLPEACAYELAAYAIAGHHAGLPDMTYGDAASLSVRNDPERIRLASLDACWTTELALPSGLIAPSMFSRPSRSDKDYGAGFQIALLGRMIFSCLVDADYRDTEDFYTSRGGPAKDHVWPALPDIVDDLTARLHAHMADKRRASQTSPVNALRDEILTHVRARAPEPTGVFTLSVPTGGGKTLASLAFALEHARIHRLDRVIVAIPFTSIIDQTASIYRDILGEEVVLEHHSSIDVEKADREGDLATRGSVNREKLRLAMEDWAAPLVVTTNVQLFGSLFSHRSSRCRKLHNIARSVIVLDEAQTIPRHVLRPSVATLDELARHYGCTIVLCTATQPALRAQDDFAGGFDIGPERELAPDPERLSRDLRRVRLRHGGTLSDEALVTALRETEQGLVIVNTRGHALALYRAAKDAGLDGLVHLTTRMCAAHRREILADVRARLKECKPCRVIATSLVEAGVDLDFPRVWRAEAGLEQIHQAAGRCNREGKRPVETSIVTIFKPAEVRPPAEIRLVAEAMGRVADRHDDLLSLAALKDYFQEVYWQRGDGLDELTSESPKLRVRDSFSIGRSGTDFDYRRVGENFRLVKSDLAPMIISYDAEAKAAVDALSKPQANAGAIARRLQSYIVQIPPKARALLMKNGHAHIVNEQRFGAQFIVLTVDKLYGKDVGLLWEDAEFVALEQYIF